MDRSVVRVALVALALLGCKDKKKQEPTTTPVGSAQGDSSSAKPPETPAAVATGAAGKNADLAKLSVDSELVAGVSWKQLRASAVYKKVESSLELDMKAAEFQAECGFDLRDAITSVTVGLENFEGEFRDKTAGTIVVHGAPKKAAMACFEKQAAKGDRAKDVTRDGDVVIVKPQGRERGFGFTWTKDDEVVIVIGGNLDKTAVMKAAGGGSALPANKDFAALYETVSPSATAYVVLNPNSKLLAKGQDAGIRAQAGVVQVSVGDGVAATARLRVRSAEEATKLAAGFQSQVQAIAGFVDKVELAADGSDLRGTASASLAKLETALAMLFGGRGK